MLSNDIKKELREYFDIKNISIAKQKGGFWDVNLFYDTLLSRKINIENEKNYQKNKSKMKRNEN